MAFKLCILLSAFCACASAQVTGSPPVAQPPAPGPSPTPAGAPPAAAAPEKPAPNQFVPVQQGDQVIPQAIEYAKNDINKNQTSPQFYRPARLLDAQKKGSKQQGEGDTYKLRMELEETTCKKEEMAKPNFNATACALPAKPSTLVCDVEIRIEGGTTLNVWDRSCKSKTD